MDATVQYGYDIPLIIYTRDKDGNYVSSDIYSLFSDARKAAAGVSGGSSSSQSGSSGSLSSSFSSFSVWSEVLGGKDGEPVSDFVKEQYDLVAGEWPQSERDVMVVVNDRDEVNDLVLYALGLRSRAEMTDVLRSATSSSGKSSGQDGGEKTEAEKWTYKQILGRTFRTVVPANLYREVDGKWQDVSGQQEVVNAILASDDRSLEMRVCCILRKKPDSASSEGSSGLLYTSALTQYLITATDQSEIVLAQKANPEINVLTGRPFPQDVSDDPTKVEAERETAFRSFISLLPDSEKAAFLETLLTSHYDPTNNKVTSFDARVKIAVSTLMKTIGTEREDIATWVNENYPEYAVFVDEIKDAKQLKIAFEGLLEIQFGQLFREQGEALYENYRNTPTEAEVAARKAQITAEATTEEQIRAAKESYSVEYYLASTELSESALEAWATDLSPEKLDKVFDRLVRAEIAADPAVTEETKDARCAAVLDGIVAGWNRTNASTAYQYFIEDGTVGSSYEETLAKLYVCNEDAPSRISIYVTTFAEKDKVTGALLMVQRNVKYLVKPEPASKLLSTILTLAT